MNNNQIKNHYKCLGCGKEYSPYKICPDGGICLDCRKTTNFISEKLTGGMLCQVKKEVNI